MSTSKRYSPEVRDRAVRLVMEHEGAYESQWAAIHSIAEKVGCTAETLRKWLRQAERDQGKRAGLSSEDRDRLKELELVDQVIGEPLGGAHRDLEFTAGNLKLALMENLDTLMAMDMDQLLEQRHARLMRYGQFAS